MRASYSRPKGFPEMSDPQSDRTTRSQPPATAPPLIEAKRNLRAENLAEHVARVVSELPPLTDAQCQRIAALLLTGGDEVR